MNTLVLGGNGFIGSHLVDALVAAGHPVRVFDRIACPPSITHAEVDYWQGDFDDGERIAQALRGVDVLYHLVSTSLPASSNQDPLADIEGNLLGSVRLLQQAIKAGVSRVVFLSSGGTVYGDPQISPVPETHALQPKCSYAINKIAIEHYLGLFRELEGLQSVVLRAANPYGPRQGHLGVQGVIPTFMARVQAGETVTVWGDGEIVRDYIYISDLVDLCRRAGESSVQGVFNAGSGCGYSINQILQGVREVTGVPVQPEYLPGRAFDVQKIVLDSSRAAAAFQWQPKVKLEQGLQAQWEWMCEVKKA